MKLFIWQRLEGMTSNYHCAAGVACVAESLEAARAAVLAERANQKATDDTDAAVLIPSASYEIVGVAEPRVWVFPDAGCC